MKEIPGEEKRKKYVCIRSQLKRNNIEDGYCKRMAYKERWKSNKEDADKGER